MSVEILQEHFFQGEDTGDDTENTEHDLSGVASSLDGNAIQSSVHDESVLEEIMEQLLDQGSNTVVHGRMEIDDDHGLNFEHERDVTVRTIHSIIK